MSADLLNANLFMLGAFAGTDTPNLCARDENASGNRKKNEAFHSYQRSRAGEILPTAASFTTS